LPIKNFKKVTDVKILGAIGVIYISLEWLEILKLREDFIKKGVFLRPFGNLIYLMTALNIEHQQLRIIIDKIKEVLIENNYN
jgi:adenosylmethionine-8-amino-7-oxononanoate aminotransferase